MKYWAIQIKDTGELVEIEVFAERRIPNYGNFICCSGLSSPGLKAFNERSRIVEVEVTVK